MGFGGILVILGFRDVLVIFWVSRVFWSFFGFRGYFGHFLGFRRYFGHFVGFGVILIIFRFWGYFGHFLGLGGYC